MKDSVNFDQYSIWVGLVYVFNLIVGTGALTLPAVFSQAGWLFGLLIILIQAFISFVTVTFVIESMASANAIIIWKRNQQHKKVGSSQDSGLDSENLQEENEPGPSNFDSEETPLVNGDNENIDQEDQINRYYILNEKIELGEMSSIFFNKLGVTFFYACLAVYLYGDLSIYGSVIGKATTDIFCTYLPQNFSCNVTVPDNELCWATMSLNRFEAYRIFLTTFVLLLGPFVFFNVQKTKYLQIITSMMRWLAFSIMIIYAITKLINGVELGSPPIANLSGVPSLFGVCVYSFMCHHSLPALIAPISNKSSLNKCIGSDYFLIASFYLLLAITGIFAFKQVDDLYTLDFSPHCVKGENIFIIIIKYFLAFFPVFTLSTSFPIIAITLRNNLQSLFFKESTIWYSTMFRKIIIPISAVLPSYLVSMYTKDLKKLVGFTGSYAGAGIQYIIPTFLVYYARIKTSKIIGLGVTNQFASPFSSNRWLIFVILWAITCMILVSMDLIEKNLLNPTKN